LCSPLKELKRDGVTEEERSCGLTGIFLAEIKRGDVKVLSLFGIEEVR